MGQDSTLDSRDPHKSSISRVLPLCEIYEDINYRNNTQDGQPKGKVLLDNYPLPPSVPL